MDIEQNHQIQIDTNNHNPEPSRRRRFVSILVNGSGQGVKPIPLAVALTVGLVTRFAIPRPEGVSARAWQLLSLFLFTVSGLVAAPLPTGAWSMVCLALTLATKTLSFAEGLTAATSEVLWLIVVSFFFARGFSKTGLGERVAVYAVRWLGRSSLGLSYGLVVAEAVVSPAIPSTTARAGGVFCPVITSLATSVGSKPNDKSARKLGGFLIQSQLQSLALHSISPASACFRRYTTAKSTSTSFLHHRRSRLSLSLPQPAVLSADFSYSSRCKPLRLISKPLAALKPPAASNSPIEPSTPLPEPSPPPQGAKLIPLVISVAIGLILRFAIPKPVEVTMQAWQLLSIFLSTIAGLVLSPLPVGAWAFISLTAAVLSRTLTFTNAFSAFTNEVIWLIVISFFFARGFVKTGLGDRIATYFVKWLGKSTLGLSYGLTFSEMLIAPAMPSTTARAGGVFLPIIKSLSLSSGSKPGDASSRKLGSFLVQSQFQSAGNSSALFLTAAAQNLLCLKLAEELGVNIASPWVTWFKAASLPALVALLVTPLVLYRIYPPEIKDTPDAPAMAAEKLKIMGPVTKNEWVMVATMLLAVSLWIFGDKIGIPSVVAAMLGLSVLLLLGVLNWDDCLSEKSAWDTLAWFAVLVGMAGQLTNLGIVSWMSGCVAKGLKAMHLSWPIAFGVLQATYFFVHYLFASQTGHVGALYSAFLAMNIASGVPGVLAALTLAYNTNLFGALTHYSSGQAAVYFGAGYVDLPDVFKLGFIMALVNVAIWIVVGGCWWKILGLY
ncbi:hypothetical protein V2J09_020633 [Rumex salicifolius]